MESQLLIKGSDNMENKLINEANVEINDAFALFNELIKDFNNDEILNEDKELQEIFGSIRKEVKDSV